MSHCAGKRMLVKVRAINMQADIYKTRRYRVYTYDACDDRLNIYHHTTTNDADVNTMDYDDLGPAVNPGGETSDIPPFGTNGEPPGDTTP